MKNMRIPILISLGIAIVGVILGSFFDLQLSQAVASRTNTFGLAVSVVAPLIGFGTLAILAGGFFVLFRRKEQYKTGLRVFFLIMAIAIYGIGVYFTGDEFFGPNGFVGAAPRFVGFLISAVGAAAFAVLGYFLFRNVTHPNAWVIFLIWTAIVGLALLIAASPIGLKIIFHRPRYRAVVDYPDIVFHQWWQPCKNYKDLMTQYSITSEEFKSFPSGHTTEAYMCVLPAVFLPLLKPEFRKVQIWSFVLAVAFAWFVAFARILAAAHYLSDVSFGMSVIALVTFIGNEVAIRMKSVQLPLEPERAE